MAVINPPTPKVRTPCWVAVIVEIVVEELGARAMLPGFLEEPARDDLARLVGHSVPPLEFAGAHAVVATVLVPVLAELLGPGARELCK